MKFPTFKIPFFNWRKPLFEPVDTFSCPVCHFRGKPDVQVPMLNSGHLHCPHCGLIRINDHLMTGRTFKPTSLIGQLIQVVGPILDYLGTGHVKNTWEFINLWSSHTLIVQRKLGDLYVQLEFTASYASDCEVAQQVKQVDEEHAGFRFTRSRLERWDRKLSPDLVSLMEKLDEQGFGFWGLYQEWANTIWVKGDYHWFNDQHCGLRGVRMHLSWR